MTAVTTKTRALRRGGFYWLPDAHESVTNILDILGRPGLEYWKREQQFMRICADPDRWLGGSFSDLEAGARVVLEKAADRGSTVHSLAEVLDAGAAVDIDAVPEQFRGYAQALIQFERDIKPITLHSESTVLNSVHKYAGTLDRICEIGGKAVLVDRKTRKAGDKLAVYAENRLQLVAYANCDLLLLTKTPDAERVPMPKIEAMASLLLREDGKYSFQYVEAPFEVFLGILTAYRWMKRGA